MQMTCMIVWERDFILWIFNTFRRNDYGIKPVNLVMLEFNLRRNFKVVGFQSKGQFRWQSWWRISAVLLFLLRWCDSVCTRLCRCHGRRRRHRPQRRGRQWQRQKRQWRRWQLPLRQRRRFYSGLLFRSYFELTLLNFFWRRNNWRRHLASFRGTSFRRQSIVDCFLHGADFVWCGIFLRNIH